MKNRQAPIGLLMLAVLLAGCGQPDASPMPEGADALASAQFEDDLTSLSTPAPHPANLSATIPSTCSATNAGGTVPPAIAICSITFIVNDVDQIVQNGDVLQASRGDVVQVKEVDICVGAFSGNGGEACVDLVPVDHSGREIASERKGTHMIKATAGCRSVPGPGGVWTVGESWQSIFAVLNHWPVDDTQDSGCASGQCERDDQLIVEFRQ
jgi:hypothetical protein